VEPRQLGPRHQAARSVSAHTGFHGHVCSLCPLAPLDPVDLLLSNPCVGICHLIRERVGLVLVKTKFPLQSNKTVNVGIFHKLIEYQIF
jgi:hypothetical protein